MLKTIKNGAAIVLVAVYVLDLLWSLFQGGSILLGLLLLAGPTAVLLYLLTQDKEYKIKNGLLPFGFGVLSLLNVPALVLTLVDLKGLFADPQAAWSMILNAVCSFAIVLCFLGTLFPPKPLLPIGSLLYLLAGGALLIWAIGSVGSLAQAAATDLSVLVGYFSSLLFYLGVFLFSLKPTSSADNRST